MVCYLSQSSFTSILTLIVLPIKNSNSEKDVPISLYYLHSASAQILDFSTLYDLLHYHYWRFSLTLLLNSILKVLFLSRVAILDTTQVQRLLLLLTDIREIGLILN